MAGRGVQGSPRGGGDLRAEPAPVAERELDEAVLRALAYSDVFDFPLTLPELHRYLVGARAGLDQVRETIARLSTGRSSRVSKVGDLIVLDGREELAEVRRERARLAAALWPVARRHGLALARLPFVRMVAVTGALAADNPTEGGDIDYLLVTEPDRLWLCRTAVIQRVRLARLGGDELCPNYLVSERALELGDGGLYAARELAQMRPLTGAGVYRRLREANPWVERHLPNALGPPCSPLELAGEGVETRPGIAARAVEASLRNRLGDRLEAWVARRRIAEIRSRSAVLDELDLDADRCKGHTQGHARRIEAAYERRLRSLGLRR